MSIPEWATHIAVDARSGEVWAFSCEPVWSERNETWNIDETERTGAAQMMEHFESVPASVARLLCVAILKPHDTPTEPANAPETHEAPP